MNQEKELNPHLANIIERNISTLLEVRNQIDSQKNIQHHTADLITKFSGSLPFVYVHVLWFLVWMAINLGWLGIPAFDPFPFGLLTMIVSLEAIFLSTFVLISQNRLAEVADQRADLDLQINLLAEYEITKVLKVTNWIANRLNIDAEKKDDELEGLLDQDIVPGEVLRQMEKREKEILSRNTSGFKGNDV